MNGVVKLSIDQAVNAFFDMRVLETRPDDEVPRRGLLVVREFYHLPLVSRYLDKAVVDCLGSRKYVISRRGSQRTLSTKDGMITLRLTGSRAAVDRMRGLKFDWLALYGDFDAVWVERLRVNTHATLAIELDDLATRNE